jgi:hypothetical protein
MATRSFVLSLQVLALVAVWAVWNPPGLVLLRLALVYVLAAWIAAGGTTLWIYLAFSLAPFADLLAASGEASAAAMWLVPGMLLLASRSSLAVAAGLAAVINSTRLLASSRAPKGETIAARRRAHIHSAPPLFRYQAQQPAHFPRETAFTMFGALALQAGVCALAGDYPLMAAVSFAAVTVVWVAMAVARGAMEARLAAGAAFPALPRILLTLLLTVTLTAALLQTEIARVGPETGATAETLAMTGRVLQRLVHVPPQPAAKPMPEAAASKAVVTQVVGLNGVPGVVLRPRPKRSPKPPLILLGSRFRFSSGEPLAIPFTGEYHLFPTSSGGLPAGAMVETGTPLENLYGTIGGGPMETVAVQTFDPPIDLTHCGKLLVALTSAEGVLLLASMQFLADGSVEDGGTVPMGMQPAREETLEFHVPVTAKPLLVHAIRILFLRAVDRDRNTQVSVEGFTLVPRAR